MPRGVYKHSKLPEKVKQKIANSLKGRPSPMKGKKHPSKGTFYSERKIIHCLQCGKEHEITIKSDRKFCNRSCASSFNNKHRSLKIPNEIRICECGCGETFECKINDTKKFKTQEHYFKWLKENPIDYSNYNWNAWNTGLTKKIDERVKKNSESTSLGVLKLWQDLDYVEKHMGENHPHWIDGSTIIYHLNFTENFKEVIRERDNQICQLCNKTEEQNGQKLSVHHIHYDTMNDCSNKDNFITLCVPCHTKTNFNREYWTGFFQLKLEETKALLEV